VFLCFSGNLYSLHLCGSAVKLYFCRRQVFYNVFALQNQLLGSDWGRWEPDGRRMGEGWEEDGRSVVPPTPEKPLNWPEKVLLVGKFAIQSCWDRTCPAWIKKCQVYHSPDCLAPGYPIPFSHIPPPNAALNGQNRQMIEKQGC
jgi:hypothetical protein